MRTPVRWLVVVGVAGMLGIGALPTPSPVAEAATRPVNKIVEENRRLGINRLIPWSSGHQVADDFNRLHSGCATVWDGAGSAAVVPDRVVNAALALFDTTSQGATTAEANGTDTAGVQGFGRTVRGEGPAGAALATLCR